MRTEKSALELIEELGIVVNSDRLSDGSVVWNVLIGDGEIPCFSERHARNLVREIAVAIRNNSNL